MIAGVRRIVVDNDWGVLGVLLVFFAGAVVGSRAAHVDSGAVNWAAWLDSFLQNAGTEMFGAALTFALIEMLRGARREREAEDRATEERKRALIRQLGSRVNEEAVRAAEELRAVGWLTDGSLQGVYLGGANLQGADLRWATLQGVGLEGANLQEARLNKATLQGAHLVEADLAGVLLVGANLQGVLLVEANLQGAFLEGTNLQEADLAEANLQGAFLERANLQEAVVAGANLRGAGRVTRDQLRETRSLRGTTLPDGTALPVDDTWREAFEAWCETVALDASGLIVPAPLDDDDGEDG
jgi:uncharacterized protein YjbI with pentapeptide repeats